MGFIIFLTIAYFILPYAINAAAGYGWKSYREENKGK